MKPMVDLYAIVRRLTGHELISPKDARLLTEAVDGLIDEIGSKDARIDKLAAENERLREQITKATDPTYLEEKLRQIGVTDEMATEALEAAARVREEANNECGEATHPASQPSVKVKPLEWDEHPTGGQQAIAAGLGLYRVHANGDDWYLVHDHMGKGGKAAAQADYERRILSALTTGNPEQVPSRQKRNRYECPTCGGSGEIAPDAECPDCDGTGACVPTSPTA